MPHAVCPHATRKRRPKLALSLRTTSRASVLLMEVPAGYHLQLFGHALARGSCTALSAHSGWSLTERALLFTAGSWRIE